MVSIGEIVMRTKFSELVVFALVEETRNMEVY